MKLRKLASLLLSAACLFSLAACGQTVGEEVEGATPDAWKITYVVSSTDEFRSTLANAVTESAKAHGVDLDFLYSGEDTNKILDCVRAAAASGREAVIINMAQSEDAVACIEAAGDMKVVFINRFPYEYSMLDESHVGVGSDEMVSGGLQGQFLADYFTEKGQTEVRYILLHGTPGLAHTEQRTEYALKGLTDAGITPVEAAVVEGNYDRATAQALLADLLSEGVPEFDCVISNNDAMAIGAILAFQDAGIDPSSFPIVGIDATADGLAQMEAGNLAMTVYQSARGQGEGSIMAAIDMLEGKPINDGTDFEISSESDYIVDVPFELVTPENMADYMS